MPSIVLHTALEYWANRKLNDWADRNDVRTITRTEERTARPIPASLAMPDHPIRQSRWYQLAVRLPRPAAEWITTGGLL